MQKSSPMPVEHHGSSTSFRVDSGLAAASHVFLRLDAVKRPLVPPYEGPFKVRCLFTGLASPSVLSPVASPAPALDPSAVSPRLDPTSWPLPTRYGRRPRPPDRLNI